MAQLAVRSSADLTRYNAQRGLQTIAIAEAAERHYARAKDATQLQRAIRAKLEAQAEFVTWWDARDKNKAGRPKKSITGLLSILKDKELAQKLGTRLMTISRWRLKLTTPESFEATYDACCARYPKILEFQTIAHVGQNSGENEWYTPGPYIEAARKVLGAIDSIRIDLRHFNVNNSLRRDVSEEEARIVVSNWWNVPLPRTTNVQRCKHRDEFKKDGRCWICMRTGRVADGSHV